MARLCHLAQIWRPYRLPPIALKAAAPIRLSVCHPFPWTQVVLVNSCHRARRIAVPPGTMGASSAWSAQHSRQTAALRLSMYSDSGYVAMHLLTLQSQKVNCPGTPMPAQVTVAASDMRRQ